MTTLARRALRGLRDPAAQQSSTTARPRRRRPRAATADRWHARRPPASAGSEHRTAVAGRHATRLEVVAQLRLALAQINPVVGDLDGNAAQVLALGPATPPTRARTWSPSPRWRSPATRSRTWRCAGRSSTRRAQRSTTLAARLATEGLGELAVVVGYLDGAPDAVAGARHARRARRRTPPPSCTAAGSSRATPSTTCPTTASSTSSATSCPARSLTVARVHGVDVAIAICEDIWQDGGPVAGRPRGRRRAAAGHQRLAVRAQQGRRAARPRARAGRPRPAARSPTSTWSAARTSWSSTATRSSSRADGDGARPGARSSRSELLVVDLDLPRHARRPTTARGAPDVDAIERVVLSADPLPAWEPAPAPIADAARATRPRSTRALVTRPARLRREERLPHGPARPLRRHRLGADRRDRLRRARRGERVRRLDARATTPREHSQDRRRRAGRAHRAALPDRADRADGRRLPGAAAR